MSAREDYPNGEAIRQTVDCPTCGGKQVIVTPESVGAAFFAVLDDGKGAGVKHLTCPDCTDGKIDMARLLAVGAAVFSEAFLTSKFNPTDEVQDILHILRAVKAMNADDKKLIDAWHQFIAHPELGSDEICHETYLVDVFAAFDRALAETPNIIDIVFDGPPGPNTGKHHCNFVECETLDGRSVRVGEWIDRGNGLWALRIPLADTPTLVEVGKRWCAVHDAPESLCSLADDHLLLCDLRPLVYVEPKP